MIRVRIPAGAFRFSGGRSSIGRAPDCGSGHYRFESGRSPFSLKLYSDVVQLAGLWPLKPPIEVRILASESAPEAQMAEHVADNRAVEGSSPSGCMNFGSVAKRLMQRPVASPIEGSSPFTPVIGIGNSIVRVSLS